MPITSLESFLFERKLVSVSPVEILRNSTLGIDVEHYLGRIYTFKKEQLLFGIGGVPVSLKAYIESDLKVFKEYNIRPLFIIPGLPIRRNDVSRNELSDSEKHRETTWSRLLSKLANTTGTSPMHFNESFRLHNDLISSRPMVNDLIKYFIELGIDFIVCPSDPSHQLSYLYQTDIVDCIYGSTDLLLTKIDRFILGMEFLSKDFRYVEKKKVLSELNLTEREFVDISIIVGCSAQPLTFSSLPPLPKQNQVTQFQQMTHFKYALELMYQYKTFHNESNLIAYVSSLNDEELMNLYLKGNAAVKYMPVMNTDGKVELYISSLGESRRFETYEGFQDDLEQSDSDTKEAKLSIPADIHDAISQRLPSEMYFYVSIGLLPSEILESIAFNVLNVRPPLEGGPCENFKTLVSSKFVNNVLDSHFNLVTQLLARYYQVKRIPVSFWYSTETQVLNSRMSPPMAMRLSSKLLKKCREHFLLARFGQDMSLVIDASRVDEAVELVHVGDIIATSVWRALSLLDHAKPGLEFTPYVINTLQELTMVHPELKGDELENLVILALVVRLGCYDLFTIDKGYQSVPENFKVDKKTTGFTENDEALFISIISRVCSLQKLRINPINYQGPISRSLLGFRTIHEYLRRMLGNSIRVCTVDLITRLSNLKTLFQNREEWYALVNQLPFYSSANNTLLGVMTEIYLDGCSKFSRIGHDDEESRTMSLNHLLEEVMQQSNHSYNINLASNNSVNTTQMISDLRCAMRFWKYFVSTVKISCRRDVDFIDKTALEVIQMCDEFVDRFSLS